MSTVILWGIAVVRFLRSRTFAVIILSALLSVTVYAASENIHTVYIRDEARTDPILLHTTDLDADTLLAQEGITLGPADHLEYTLLGDGDGAEIYIERAFSVQVHADQQSHEIWTTGGTVRDILDQAHVTINDEDLISMPTTAFVSDGDVIEINRVAYRESKEEEEIPYEVEEQHTPLLRNGRRMVLQYGSEGTLVKTYSERTIDGVVEEATLVGEKVTEHPVEEFTLVGADVPVSDLDFGYSFEDGVPVGYQEVISDAKAAGYYAGERAHGASGNELGYGHVAVNPNEIPYGSKLYIQSSDGEFVYGYAIASDTGLALMQDSIDIDLYYETYEESLLNSIRSVDIYVLE